MTDPVLDELVRAADPLRHDALPSEADTEEALHRLLAARRSPSRAAGRRRSFRPGAWAGVSAGIAILMIALALYFGGTGSQPALAITKNANGTVTVRVNAADIPAAELARTNRKLAVLGVRARIVKVSSAPLVRCGPAHALTFTPGRIPVHRMVILGADRAGHIGFTSSRLRVIAMTQRLARIASKRAVVNARVPAPRMLRIGQLSYGTRVRVMSVMALCGSARPGAR